MKPHRGAIVLVYGVLGLIICPLLSVAALLMGSADLKEMQAHKMDASGRTSRTQVGFWGSLGP